MRDVIAKPGFIAASLVLLEWGTMGLHAQANQVSRSQTLENLRDFAQNITVPEAYLREHFFYPAENRPDPLSPPSVIASREETLPELRLTAILYDDLDPSRSVAMLRSSLSPVPHRAQVGDRFGEIQVIDIRPSEVVISTVQLGVVQTSTLTLRRP